MPAAAVIPAPIAYIKVVAVKKLVVGYKTRPSVYRQVVLVLLRLTIGDLTSLWVGLENRIYCEEIRVFKAGIIAWIRQHGIIE